MGKFSDIIKSDTPTLVNFYATWCGPCQAMHPIVDKLQKELGGKVRILKIDVDKNIDVSDQFKIKSVPTFMLFKKGESLWRQSGAMDLATLKKRVSASLS